jgi:AAA lid domain
MVYISVLPGVVLLRSTVSRLYATSSLAQVTRRSTYAIQTLDYVCTSAQDCITVMLLYKQVDVTLLLLLLLLLLMYRYLTERKLPDSAIDLMDEAASRMRMQQESKPEAIEKVLL